MVAAMASGAIASSSSQFLSTEGCSQEGGGVAQELAQMASFGICNAGFRRRARGLNSTSAPALIQPMRANLAQQMKKMQAAQGRWETQLRNGSWISVSAREARDYIDSGDYYFLDVRPSTEHSKALVKGSVWIPMYDVNKNADPATLYSKIQNWTMGGWWSGQALMKYNERFMPDIVARIPKSSKIVVACQKGLRSLAACEQLYKVGYRNLYWLSGGLDAVFEGELEREGLSNLQALVEFQSFLDGLMCRDLKLLSWALVTEQCCSAEWYYSCLPWTCFFSVQSNFRSYLLTCGIDTLDY